MGKRRGDLITRAVTLAIGIFVTAVILQVYSSAWLLIRFHLLMAHGTSLTFCSRSAPAKLAIKHPLDFSGFVDARQRPEITLAKDADLMTFGD